MSVERLGTLWGFVFVAGFSGWGCQDTSPRTPKDELGQCKLAGTYVVGAPEIVSGTCPSYLPEARQMRLSPGELPDAWQLRYADVALAGTATPESGCALSTESATAPVDGRMRELRADVRVSGNRLEASVEVRVPNLEGESCDATYRLVGVRYDGPARGNPTGGNCGLGATCSANACAYGGVDACRYQTCVYERTTAGESVYCSEPCVPGACPEGFRCREFEQWAFDTKGTAFCAREPQSCGDGELDGNEVCDDGNTQSGDGCAADCLSDESCGNGIVDTAASEECDDGNTQSGDGCSSACKTELCGNGRVEANETCDDNNRRSGDGCSAECQLEECGNGVIDIGEGCDDGDLDDTDRCSSDCRAQLRRGSVRLAGDWARQLVPDADATVAGYGVAAAGEGRAVVAWSEDFKIGGGPYGNRYETFVSRIPSDAGEALAPAIQASLRGWQVEDLQTISGDNLLLLVRAGSTFGLSRSYDGGATFGPPEPLQLADGNSLPVQRPQGAFGRLIGAGESWNLILGINVNSVPTTNRNLYVLRSTDGGESWGELTRLSPMPDSDGWASLPRLHWDADGTLALVWGDGPLGAGGVYAAISNDHGASWVGQPERLGAHASGRQRLTWAGLDAQGAPERVVWNGPDGLQLAEWSQTQASWQVDTLLPAETLDGRGGPAAVARGTTGSVHIVFAAGRRLFAMRSADGAEFSAPKRIGRIEGDAANDAIRDVALAMDLTLGTPASDRLAVLFVSDATGGDSVGWRPYGVQSDNGGATFGRLATDFAVGAPTESPVDTGAWRHVNIAPGRDMAVMSTGAELWLVSAWEAPYTDPPQDAPTPAAGGCGEALDNGGWCTPSTQQAPSARFAMSATAGAGKAIFFGGRDGFRRFANGGMYDPSDDSWTPIPSIAASDTLGAWGRSGHSAVWMDGELMVFGGHNGLAPLGDGAIYNPSTDSWRSVAAAGAPQPRYGHTAVWTGEKVVIFGGRGVDGPLADGGLYDPDTDTWSGPFVDPAEPTGRVGHSSVAAADSMHVFGGMTDASTYTGSGFAYSFGSGAISTLPDASGPEPRAHHASAWTGTEMLIWGGEDLDGLRNDGAVYTPGSGWSPIAAAGAPSARDGCVHVWTGDVWVVWGGTADSTGAQLDPALNQWTATPTAAAPEPRWEAGAVWLGDRMLVFGGRDTSGKPLRSAGAYVPIGPQ